MRSNMFGYAGAPMPLPRLRPPGTSTISHAFRTPESSTSEEEDRTDLLGRSFQTSSRPKSRSSLAVSMHPSTYIYDAIVPPTPTPFKLHLFRYHSKFQQYIPNVPNQQKYSDPSTTVL